MNYVKKIAVEVGEGGEREITIVGVFNRGQEIEADDVALLTNALDELSGSETEPEVEVEDKPRRSRRGKAKETEEEPEEEEKPARRRRAKARETEEEDEKPARRTRRKKADLDDEIPFEDEPEEEKPKRAPRKKRASSKKPAGPTKADVAKAAAAGAAELGTKITGDIILEWSEDGTIDSIEAENRKEFIDAVNFELDAE